MKQVQDAWKTKHPKMAELCKQAKELKSQFKSFHIEHIDRVSHQSLLFYAVVSLHNIQFPVMFGFEAN